MQRLQLLFEPRDRWCIKEAERDGTILAMHSMMHAVRLIQTLQIATPGNIVKRPALMHQTVVGNEIQHAIGSHTGPYPFKRMAPFCAEVNQYDGDASKNDSVQIVFFKPARARLVMRAMPAPAKTMHHIFMRAYREQLHQYHGTQHDQYID